MEKEKIKKAEYDLSFIIVSWNVREYLKECISSIIETVNSIKYEIIVIDNASVDGTIEAIQTAFPGIILIKNKQNTGFSDANNKGIIISRGRYLCLINPDVKVLPYSIEKLFKFIKTHKDIGILGPKVLNSDLSLQPSCRTFPNIYNSIFRAFKLDTMFKNSAIFAKHFMTDWDYNDTREVDILSGCFWMINRAAINCIGLLDERFFLYGEDMDLCKRFKDGKWKIVFFHEAKIIHYGGASSDKDPSRFWIEMQRANLQYWLKHYGKFYAFLYYLCLILHNCLRVAGILVQCKFNNKNLKTKAKKYSVSRYGTKWLLNSATIKSLIKGKFAKGGNNEV